MQDAVSVALAFVRSVERGVLPLELLADDVVEEELPNRIFAAGATRDLAAMKAGVERGRSLFRSQHYEVRGAYASDSGAALELDWSGELAVPVATLSAGATMRARCAFVFAVQGGRIARIRHWDSFEPF
jgi:ketosteroid isomerase-like protein